MDKWPDHDPDAVLDYGRLWSPWLGTDTIVSSIWLIIADEDDEVPVAEESSSHTATTTTIWLQGGTPGKRYTVTNRITTAGGRTNDRSVRISCKER